MLQSILLQAQGGGGGVMNLIFIGLIIIVFYFFMIRPQQKKAKEAKTFRENIKRGDEVVTIGGLHGKVAEVNDTTIVLEVDRTVRLTFEKSAISMESSAPKQTVK